MLSLDLIATIRRLSRSFAISLMMTVVIGSHNTDEVRAIAHWSAPTLLFDLFLLVS